MKRTKRLLSGALCFVMLGSLLPAAAFADEERNRLPAFPGAEGGGMYTSGGRGGEVYEVTTLEDDDKTPIPGSLRDAVSRGNRTIVFRVSGTIRLKSRLNIKQNNLTIAGQTAPGDGITVADYDTYVTGSNIIIRYMRFRAGSAHIDSEPDGIWSRGAKNIMVDHVSAGWSTDESLSFYKNTNMTVQWSIISESLTMSGHFKGRHGYGGIWGGKDATFHHNLLANHTSRLPRVEVGGNKADTHATIDMRNNVIYNWQYNSTYGGDEASINIVNNYYKPGPGTQEDVRKRIANPSYTGSDWYVDGNVVEGSPEVTADNKLGIFPSSGIEYNLLSEPIPIAGEIVTQTAEEAYRDVLAKAGAILPRRDAVDARIVQEVANGEGRFINREYEVGGYPEMKSAEAPTDTDHDGMPDAWEEENGLDPNNPKDGAMTANNGYTNLENYLNSLADPNFVPDNPVIRLTSPQKDQLFGYRTSVNLTAEAADSDGIEKVEFYNGDLKLGEVKEAPYEYKWNDVQEGTFYVSARAIDKNGNATQSTAVPIHVNYLPIAAPWVSKDIGTPGIPGSASQTPDGIVTVKGAGAVQGKADAFQFTYQPLEGDGEIVARIESIGRIDNNAVGGLMIRETLDADSPMAGVSTSYVKSDKQATPYSAHFLSRAQKGGNAIAPLTHVAPDLPTLEGTRLPIWFKLKREGDVFTGYASTDGKEWTQVGSQTIPMGKSVYAGLAVDGAKNQQNQIENYNAVKFSNVTLTGTSQPLVGTYTDKPNDTVLAAEQKIGGFFNKPAEVSVKLNGSSVGTAVKVNANSTWSQDITLRKGRNVLEVTAKDAQGGHVMKQDIVYIGAPHAIVDAAYKGEEGGKVNGVPTFKSVQNAVNAVPDGNAERFVIFIRNGVYKEPVVVDKPFVSFLGESAEKTVVTYDNAAGTPKPGGGTLGTSGSASVLIKSGGSGFTAENLTFENSFDESMPYSGKQAVALKSEGDRLIFKNVRFYGNQDTLYPNKGRQYFTNSYIEGDVDFVFGAAQAVFDDTVLRSTYRGSDSNNGYVTAASTDIKDKYGFLFNNCRLVSDSPANTVALGRPWHPGGKQDAIASVVFKNCFMGDHISDKGWEDMSGFKAADARFAEYGSTGPGAKASATRKVLTAEEASEYTAENVFKEWNPKQELADLYAPVYFGDLAGYGWASDAIASLAEQGIVNGKSDFALDPGGSITRGAFVSLLKKALNFKDAAAQADPDAKLTRQDMFVLAAKALRQTGKLADKSAASGSSAFADQAAASPAAAADLAQLAQAGLLEGNDGKLRPAEPATRAEAIVLLYRMLKK